MDYNKEDLEKNIVSIFNGHDGDEMSRSDFLKELKRVYHCTQKEAVFLLGAAQRIRLVGMTDSTVRLL
ncbi:hypothetical protein [Prevotella dentasini]|uniref:hypothetical protein n=1 Tax=Prevotella dentasini TaxID=589537 RepID=UPI000A9A50AF|nr:hypothetical protein [Prevotella dentasini]